MNYGIAEALMDQGVSLEDIERLFQVYGGLPLYVPKNFDPDHTIAVEVGAAVAMALCSVYGGSQPVIPLGEELHRNKVRLEVRGLAKSGKNAHEIVRLLRGRGTRLHLRQVYRIVSRMDAADRPPKEDPRQQYFL